MTLVRELATGAFWLELERVLECMQRRIPVTTEPNLIASPQFAQPQNGLNGSLAPLFDEHTLLDSPDSVNPVAQLRSIFDLTAFELDTLLLCAGSAIDARFQSACAAIIPGAHAGASPSFGLAMNVLDDPHWSSFSGQRPLRYWRLLEIGQGPLLQAPVQIDERILHFLLGVPSLDDRLEALVHPLPSAEVADDLIEPAMRALAHWRSKTGTPLLITGASAEQRTALFLAACRQAGVRALHFDAADLHPGAAERESLARTLTRESALCPSATLVRTNRLEHSSLLESWITCVDALIAIEVEPGSAAERIAGVRIEASSITHAERRAMWIAHLGPLAPDVERHLDQLVDVFALGRAEIRDTAAAVREESSLGIAGDGPAQTAWRICRATARRSMDDLASRAESLATWNDLVLPAPQLEVLRQIVANARQSSLVLRGWGFSTQYSRGLGLSALFSGTSGTGKTMAAGILARELDRDLYQIDLATVTSKYIGETEKHLRRIFDAAERSGAILLFDEADALFGKRSQVRDSHDRYANLEISYLLQRMESYRGIAILTTNMQNTLDPAFQRRLRFVVQFPFPDAESRERIWRGVFPAAAPLGNLDYTKLALLSVTGGVIRNIALLAAFMAADEGSAISMRHIAAAARTEYAKLDKPLSNAETRGWE
jgi:hypothetical protein